MKAPYKPRRPNNINIKPHIQRIDDLDYNLKQVRDIWGGKPKILQKLEWYFVQREYLAASDWADETLARKEAIKNYEQICENLKISPSDTVKFEEAHRWTGKGMVFGERFG